MNISEGKIAFADLKLGAIDFENPRTHSGLSDGEIVETALSIVRHGLLVPLLVRDDGLVLAGKRRYHALDLLRDWLHGNVDSIPEVYGPDPRGTERARARIRVLLDAIPVRFVTIDSETDEVDYQALSLVDNLFRSDLSSYEIAAALADLSQHGGKSGAAIAGMIGKSPSYVSRKLAAWKKSGPELRAAWRDGMAEDTVEEFAKLSFENQAKALAGKVPRGRRGPAHRPSVDAVRDLLYELESAGSQRDVRAELYRAGVIDALRWATGEKVGPEFVKLAEPEPEQASG